MKNIITALAVLTASNVAFADASGGPWVVRKTVEGIKWTKDKVVEGAEAALDFADNGVTECVINYKKKGGVLLIGATVGNADMTCKNDFYDAPQTANLDTFELIVGPAAGFFAEEGEIRLAGYGTSIKQIAGFMLNAKEMGVIDRGSTRGAHLGAFVGPTGKVPAGANVVWGTSRGKITKGKVAGGVIGIELYMDSRPRKAVVDFLKGDQAPPAQEQQQQQQPAQQNGQSQQQKATQQK